MPKLHVVLLRVMGPVRTTALNTAPGEDHAGAGCRRSRAAEQQVKGRAVRAELENARQGWVYDVEVIQGAKVIDVKVDTDKASVISAEQDRTDRDTDQDKQD